MPVETPFNALGAGNGFPFCLSKVDVSGFDYWTTLSGVRKSSPSTSDALIWESLENATKLYWDYNGHGVDFEFTEVNIDIEQGDFDSGSAPAPFGPRDRICRIGGWAFSRSDQTGGDEFMRVEITPIRMYNGSTNSEDNFVGYGVLSSGSVLDGVFLATDQFDDFSFLSYADDGETGVESYEYNSAVDGIWFVAGARGGDSPPSINGLSAEFLFEGGGTLTFTYSNFDFYTY